MGDCYVCKGKAMQTDEMIKNAAGLLEKEDIESFSISTVIPKDWLIREEEVWDRALEGQSIKDFVNKRIVAMLRKATGKRYESDGDCRVIFDYGEGKASIQRNELFVFGRYLKLVSGLSQSRWTCKECEGKGCEKCGGKGKNYESVEERIGEPFKAAAQADDYVLHASGREDVDATNTAGRPFILMLKTPRKRNPPLDEISGEIARTNEVKVRDLSIVGRGFVEIVTESHFDKTYEAVVEFGREISGEEIETIKSLSGRVIAQKTPKRVAHRRADLVRHRKIKMIGIDVKGNCATVRITAEAGTYIKELISGDDGRTMPSISGLLGTKAECKKLNVAKIDDGFLDFCLEMRK